MNIKVKNFVLTTILIITSCAPSTPALTPTPNVTPTLPPSEGISLQEGNDLPSSSIRSELYSELVNNRIGDSFPLDRNPTPCPSAYNDWPFAHVRLLGLKWVRLSLDIQELEAARNAENYSQFEINQCQDEAITNLAENELTILYTLVYWDEDLHAEKYPNFKSEEDVRLFLDYTRMIVNHFRGHIQYYEILNEAYFYVDAQDYIELIRRVIPVIREEDPEAKIVVGGTTNLMFDHSQEYIKKVIQSDIIKLVDGIAMHPMYGSSPQYEDTQQYYYDYPILIQDIKDTASSNGFKGEFFAEEMNWRTAISPNIYEPWEFTPVVAAKYYARSIIMNLGLDLWVGIGSEKYETIPQIVTVIQNLSTIMAGFKPDELIVEIESEADNIVHYSFSTQNGDRLLALWTDGIAIEEDSGVKASLFFENLTGEKAMVIDVLNDVEQELKTEMIGNKLVIQDLLINDYPIIIKFIKAMP